MAPAIPIIACTCACYDMCMLQHVDVDVDTPFTRVLVHFVQHVHVDMNIPFITRARAYCNNVREHACMRYL